MLTKDKIEKIDKIEGYLSIDEGLLLYKLGSKLKNGALALEIGSFKGKSTVWTANGIKDSGRRAKVVAVDHGVGDPDAGIMDTKPVFLRNIRESGIEDLVEPIFLKSTDAIKGWQRPLDLLFIDAAHDYPNVHEDFKFAKFLKDGAYVVFHDTLNPCDGPAKVIIREMIKEKAYSDYGVVDSIMFARKDLNHKKRITLREYVLIGLLNLQLGLSAIIEKLPKRGFRKRVVRFTMKSVLRKVFKIVASARV